MGNIIKKTIPKYYNPYLPTEPFSIFTNWAILRGTSLSKNNPLQIVSQVFGNFIIFPQTVTYRNRLIK